MALIAFPPAAAEVPLIHAALGGPPPARWINPDHITSLIPVTRQGDGDVELVVDYKLQGLPEGRWHRGRYRDVDQAHAAWEQLIQHIAAHSHDPRHH